MPMGGVRIKTCSKCERMPSTVSRKFVEVRRFLRVDGYGLAAWAGCVSAQRRATDKDHGAAGLVGCRIPIACSGDLRSGDGASSIPTVRPQITSQ